MQLSSARTPLQVKSEKRELSFMGKDLPIIPGIIINNLRLVKSSSIPKEENYHV
jgi:hypothetical protein